MFTDIEEGSLASLKGRSAGNVCGFRRARVKNIVLDKRTDPEALSSKFDGYG